MWNWLSFLIGVAVGLGSGLLLGIAAAVAYFVHAYLSTRGI